MLASFNYYGPGTGVFVVGGVCAVGVLFLLAMFRSAWIGLIGGALSWGGIAAVVFGQGSGDMTDLLQMVYGVICGGVGAVAGLIAGLMGKWLIPASPAVGPTADIRPNNADET